MMILTFALYGLALSVFDYQCYANVECNDMHHDVTPALNSLSFKAMSIWYG